MYHILQATSDGLQTSTPSLGVWNLQQFHANQVIIYEVTAPTRAFSEIATTYMYINITFAPLSPKQAFFAQSKVLTTSQVW